MLSSPHLVGAAIGAAVAVLGWLVSHYFTLKREKERFRNESVAKEIALLLDASEALSQKAISYHLQTRSPVVERDILGLFSQLDQRLQHLPLKPEQSDMKSDASSAAIRFKQAATGWHFEDEHEAPVEASDHGVGSIQLGKHDLHSTLLSIRSSCY